LEYQALLYLPLGFISLIAASLLTKPEADEKLNNFYALLHTPVGEEYKLKEAGVPVMLAGDSVAATESAKQGSLEENGHGLLLVDLLSLRANFSVRRYRVDLQGFALGALAVAGIIGLALLTARLGTVL
jgi:predicted exporter